MNIAIFISGWSKVDIGWGLMRARMEREGWDTAVATYDGRGFDRIQRSANCIAEKVAALVEVYPQSAIIGHSMGGLVGRELIQKHGIRPSAFVSLGTPHKGTHLARFCPWSRSAQQMVPGSKLLNRLNSSPWPDVPALALSAQFEELVLPRSNAMIDFGENIVVPRTNHLSLILSERVMLEMWAWLNETLENEYEHRQKGVKV